VNPCVVDNSLNEHLDATLSGIISLVVLSHGSPGGFGANAVSSRSFCVDVWVKARRTGGWAYEGIAVVMKNLSALAMSPQRLWMLLTQS
jgi:hypothetical protein